MLTLEPSGREITSCPLGPARELLAHQDLLGQLEIADYHDGRFTDPEREDRSESRYERGEDLM